MLLPGGSADTRYDTVAFPKAANGVDPQAAAVSAR
jgi:hypothetical protein